MRTVDDAALVDLFLRAVETESLSAAAEAEGLSKAAVSRRIAALEARLGRPLFVRDYEGVRLTPFGEAFRQRAVPLMLRFHGLARSLSTVKDDSIRGLIRISSPSAIGNGLLLPWIRLFQDEHPDLTIDLTLTLGPMRLMPPGCDIRISHGLFPCERVITHPLGDMLRMMVASPAYLARRGTPRRPEDLSRHDLLGGNDLVNGCPLIVIRGNERISVPYLPRLRLKDHGAARTAALCGAGIAVHAFRYDTADLVRSGKLIHVLPDWTPESTPVSLLLPAARPVRPEVEELVRFIESKWRSHPCLATPEDGGIH